MQYTYITAFLDLSFNEKLKSPIKIKNNLHITNNPIHINKFISNDKYITIGSLEAELITSGAPVIYRKQELSNPLDAHTETINLLREAQAFLMAIWLHKDNSANCEQGFALCQESPHTHSNSLALHYTTCEGTKKHTILSTKEVEEICSTHSKFLQGAREQDMPIHTKFRSETNRIDRAILFLQQARSGDDLGQKIANYCSFFEALFSTSSAELSHQLSERCAFFLEDSPDRRFERFKQIKKAYGIRSKVVHGDTLSPSLISSLPEISKNCDNAARSSINKIIDDKNLIEIFNGGKNEQLDKLLLDLIFGIT